MGKKPYMEFFVNDFTADTRSLSATTTGIWIRALCHMHWQQCGSISGTRPEICRICGCTDSELDDALNELLRQKVASVTESHGIVTLTSRRITRELKEREQARIRQTRKRKKEDCHGSVTEKSEIVTNRSSSSCSSSSSKDVVEVPCNAPDDNGLTRVFGAWQEYHTLPPRWEFESLRNIFSWMTEVFTKDGISLDPAECLVDSIETLASIQPPPTKPMDYLRGIVRREMEEVRDGLDKDDG